MLNIYFLLNDCRRIGRIYQYRLLSRREEKVVLAMNKFGIFLDLIRINVMRIRNTDL